jgi:hypothetical protein
MILLMLQITLSRDRIDLVSGVFFEEDRKKVVFLITMYEVNGLDV